MNQAGHVLQRPPKSLELRPEKGMERWGLLQISAIGDWRGRGEERRREELQLFLLLEIVEGKGGNRGEVGGF